MARARPLRPAAARAARARRARVGVDERDRDARVGLRVLAILLLKANASANHTAYGQRVDGRSTHARTSRRPARRPTAPDPEGAARARARRSGRRASTAARATTASRSSATRRSRAATRRSRAATRTTRRARPASCRGAFTCSTVGALDVDFVNGASDRNVDSTLLRSEASTSASCRTSSLGADAAACCGTARCGSRRGRAARAPRGTARAGGARGLRDDVPLPHLGREPALLGDGRREHALPRARRRTASRSSCRAPRRRARPRAPGLGYDGVPSSLAVEFDTHYNPELLEPYENHVAVHARGGRAGARRANSANHSHALARAVHGVGDLAEGEHVARVTYTPRLEADALFSGAFEASAHAASFLAAHRSGAQPRLARRRDRRALGLRRRPALARARHAAQPRRHARPAQPRPRVGRLHRRDRLRDVAGPRHPRSVSSARRAATRRRAAARRERRGAARGGGGEAALHARFVRAHSGSEHGRHNPGACGFRRACSTSRSGDFRRLTNRFDYHALVRRRQSPGRRGMDSGRSLSAAARSGCRKIWGARDSGAGSTGMRGTREVEGSSALGGCLVMPSDEKTGKGGVPGELQERPSRRGPFFACLFGALTRSRPIVERARIPPTMPVSES